MGVVFWSCEDLHTYRNVVTDNPTFHVTDEIESIDIDTEFDFMVAEYVYRKLNELDYILYHIVYQENR